MSESIKNFGIDLVKIFLWIILSILYVIYWGFMFVIVKFGVPILNKIKIYPPWAVSTDINSAWKLALTHVGFSTLSDLKIWNRFT